MQQATRKISMPHINNSNRQVTGDDKHGRGPDSWLTLRGTGCRRWMVIISTCILCLMASTGSAVERRTPLHPPVPLLDAAGQHVVKSGKPVSTITTCSACHNTQYIATHSFHAWVGRNEQFELGSKSESRPWDYSPGSFGRWDPISYRYLTPPGDAKLDLSTAEWIQYRGWRHAGGGPAIIGHGTHPLNQRSPAADKSSTATDNALVAPDDQILDTKTGQPKPWDWKASGTVEMNCFLCHLEKPANAARKKELAAGDFAWASTATLSETGLVQRAEDGWKYEISAFTADGKAPAKLLGLRDPTSQHCGQCHGQVYFGQKPLLPKLDLKQWSTATKGQIFSPQRISMSGMNIQGKELLTRPWDVHAGVMLECRNCHFSLNDPATFKPPSSDQPAHLNFEPRRLTTAQFVTAPNHEFAKGATAQGTVARNLEGTMRQCNQCHDADAAHDWLPYRDLHFAQLSCEACNISMAYAPALKQIDWTLVDPQGNPNTQWRGIDGKLTDPTAEISGFQPVLLPHKSLDGRRRLTPFNLVAAWYWVEGGESPRPVRLVDLKAALLDGDHYHSAVLQALDTNKDKKLQPSERILDTEAKVAAVRARLEAVGIKQPHIESEIQPYGLHHGVGPANFAIRECGTCHRKTSRLGQPFQIATQIPGGVIPKLVGDSDVTLAGDMVVNRDKQLVLQPNTQQAGLYVFGHSRWAWVNRLGALAFILTLLGVIGHGLLRVLAARKRKLAAS